MVVWSALGPSDKDWTSIGMSFSGSYVTAGLGGSYSIVTTTMYVSNNAGLSFSAVQSPLGLNAVAVPRHMVSNVQSLFLLLSRNAAENAARTRVRGRKSPHAAASTAH